MDQYVIYLKCTNGAGYFTNIKLSSTSKEVGVHPYIRRAHRFEDRNAAFMYAKNLKSNYKCIISYEVIKL